MLNILDILETAETDYGSYTRHIGKLKIIYKFFKRTADENEISMFSNMLDTLYRKFNLRGDDGKKITGLSPESYPTISDLLSVINEELNKPMGSDLDKVQQGLDLERRKILLKVQTTISDMVSNFGQIFDGPFRDRFPGIGDEQIDGHFPFDAQAFAIGATTQRGIEGE